MNLTSVSFDSSDNNFVLTTTNGTDKAALTSDFNGKKVVIWVAEDCQNGVVKASISNYAANDQLGLSRRSVAPSSGRESVTFSSEDTTIYRIMYSHPVQ